MGHYFHHYLKKLVSTGLAALVFCAVQVASAQSVTLIWNANPEPDIAGYRLHYGTASQTYTQVIDVGNSTTATLSNLASGSTYFFVVIAYNTTLMGSPPSNEVSATVGVSATPTATTTATPRATATATPSPTPPPTVNISGQVSNCSNPSPGPVPNVTLTLTGTASGSTLSNVSGNYTFASLAAGGSYIVTPTKSALTPGSPGITTVDVIATQRHFLNIASLLPGCQLTAADVNSDTAVNTIDVIAIQRFFLTLTSGTANTGNYQFTPADRTYPGVVTNQAAQNYDTLVFGDVASPFADRMDVLPEPVARGAVAEVALPEVVIDQFVTNFSVPVTARTINADDRLVGFQGDFTFDERVVTFRSEPVRKAGITGGDWNVSGNVLPGAGPIRTLRISAYSNDFAPLSGSGTLFNLNMIRVGVPGASTVLTWAAGPDQFILIDADLNTQAPRNAAPGSVILP